MSLNHTLLSHIIMSTVTVVIGHATNR